MSKVFASEESLAVCVEALELWGATGYMKKNPIEKLLRDAISFLHSDGTNDVLSLKAATFMSQQRLVKTDKRYSKRVAEAALGQ